MAIIDKERFWEYRFWGVIGFGGIFIIVHYERIGVWLLYKYFRLKIHNVVIQRIISLSSLLVGWIIYIAAIIPSLINKSTSSRIILFTFGLILIGGIRYIVKETDFFYFPLDDEFYKDKNGEDIRLNQKDKNKDQTKKL